MGDCFDALKNLSGLVQALWALAGVALVVVLGSVL